MEKKRAPNTSREATRMNKGGKKRKKTGQQSQTLY